jgi:ATP-dependent Clp protease ATP-binding subunit ClpB
MQEDGTISQEVENRVLDQLKSYFRPEFLNRIDDIVLFNPLTKDEIIKIIDISLKGLERRLKDRDIHLKLTAEAKYFIADSAYDPHYGARPIKRYLQKHIETEIASMIIRGELIDGEEVLIDSDGNDLVFTVIHKD